MSVFYDECPSCPTDEVYRSYEIFGNATDKRIRFEDEAAVARLAGKPVTLTVEMLDCDLYAIRFA